MVLRATPRSATTRAAGRCPRRRRRASSGCAPSRRAGRAATASAPGRPASAAPRRRAGPLASLAHSTRASFLRQLGGHAGARDWDGRALALAGGPTPRRGADALIGLAADALGVGRFAASARRCSGRASRARRASAPRAAAGAAGVGRAPSWRWPAATAPDAVRHAERAVELAATLGVGAARREVQVVLAAALCSAGELEASRRVADAALSAHRAPRSGPAALGVGLPARRHRQRRRDRRPRCVAIRDACAARCVAAGGVWSAPLNVVTPFGSLLFS